MFGLKKQDIALILGVLQKHADIQEAILYGSRAMGNFKPGSDVDIALKGDLKTETVSDVRAELNERLPLSYTFDIISYSAITHQPLIAHIDQYGITLYIQTT